MSETLNPNTTQNFHGCLIQIEGRGVLITGPSGSGKTSLMLGLLEAVKHAGKQGFFISDDQIILNKQSGVLLGSAPETIAGKAEIYGFGIVDIANINCSTIDLIAHLSPDDNIERMPEPEHIKLLGIEIPEIKVPERHEAQSIRIVFAKLAALAK
jgi:serine kinase of HPr protein (carbohydrate metabolism regulator)